MYGHINWIKWIEAKMILDVQFSVVEDLHMEIANAYGILDQSSFLIATIRGWYFIGLEQIVRAMIYCPTHVGL